MLKELAARTVRSNGAGKCASGAESTMRLLLRTFLALLLLLALAAGVLVWRLSQGPVSLALVEPLIQELVDRGSPYRTSFAEPMLVWLPSEAAIGLAARDIELRSQADEFVGGAPFASAAVALRPLLDGRIEPVHVNLTLPQIELTREADGGLVLSFAGQLASLPLGEGREDQGFSALLGDGTGAPDPTLARLRDVQVTAPALVYADEATGRTATANDPSFELRREDGVWVVGLTAGLEQGRVAVEARSAPGAHEDSVRIQLDRFPLEGLLALLPKAPELQLSLPVSGTVTLAVNRGGLVPGATHLDLSTADASIASKALGLPPATFTRAELEADLRPGWQEAEISRLLLVGTGLELSAVGTMSRQEGDLAGDLAFTAQGLDAGRILSLWPQSVGAGARDWVAANVTAGLVESGTLHLGRSAARPGQQDIGASVIFSGATVRYLDTMPPATGVAGTASFAGDMLSFAVQRGQTGNVEAIRGQVTLSNVMADAVSQLKVDLDLRSSVAAAMTVLDAEPVGLGKATGLSARGAAGQQTSSLQLSLPLLDTIPPDQIRFRVRTQLNNLLLRDVRPGYDLAARSLVLTTDQAGLASSGEVEVNGVPATVSLRENFQPVRGVQRTVDLRTRLSAVAVRALRLDWPAPLAGALDVTARLVEGRNPLRSIDMSLDLRDLQISLPELMIMKRPGHAGTATARLVQTSPTAMAVESLMVDAGSLQARGTLGLRLDPVRPDYINLTNLQTSLGSLTALVRLEQEVWRGRVDIGRLDLRPLRAAPAGGGSSGGSTPLPDMAVQVTAQQLRLGDAPFRNLSAAVDRRGGIWRSATLQAAVEDSEVVLNLSTTRNSALTVHANDAGWLIRALDNSDHGVRGGSFRLSADFQQRPGNVTGSGELKIRNFTLWGAPLVARIISLASFSGLSNALSGRGVPVSRLVVPFSLDGDRLSLEQARLVAADIGARADGTVNLATGVIAVNGTVAPAYTINRILGRIPILGRILSGSGSDAALAATFSISNTLAEPSVSVNPLSVLVPGMVRDLFSALTADDSSDLSPTDQR